MKKQLLITVMLLFIGVQMGNARPGVTVVDAENIYDATRMYDLPTATIVGFTTPAICSGTAAELVIQGTPNAIVSYTINGASQPDVTLSNTGTIIIDTGILTVTTTTTFTYALTNVQSTAVPPESNTIVGQTATVTVYDLPWATIAAYDTTVCLGDATYLYFTGTPNATVTYTDFANNFTTTLNNEGNSSVVTGPLYTATTFNLAYAENYGIGCSNLLTESVTFTINANAAIIENPFDTTVCEGQGISLSVIATGPYLTYQWYRNWNPIAGATSATYTDASVTFDEAGDYVVSINGSCGPSVTSSVATVFVNPPATFLQQPVANNTVCVGQSVSLSAIVVGTNLTYQWYKESTAIAGATGPTYTIPSATVADSGNYTLAVTSCETITSSIAEVVVNNGTGGSSCGDTIQLIAFVDANSNGVKEATEAGFGYGSFIYQKNNAGTTYYASNPMGVQHIYDSNTATTYDFDYEINSEYAAYYAETPTNFNDLNIVLGSGVQTLYFPITLTQTYNDVEVSLIANFPPRPGFPDTHQIVYKNVGHNPSAGTITYTKSNANIAITSTTPFETTTTSDGFTYNYTNLLPGQTSTILVNMQVPIIPTVNLGDIVTNAVSIAPIESDVNLTNNSFTTVQTVVGSYDPNDKTEARGESVQIGQFTQGEYLYYTIRFQNTGTASAETVRIEDNLTSDFDFVSVRMISASHDYTMQRINDKLVWTFNTINLPSENANEPGSHGYVLFKIKLNAGFAVGDVIENTAEIYFDFNPAIITNMFQTTFVPNLSTGSFDANNIVVYPNPAKEVVQVTLQNATETISKVVIYDIIGKTIKTFTGNKAQQATINVSDLAAGVYMIEITTGTNLKQIRKFIVN